MTKERALNEISQNLKKQLNDNEQLKNKLKTNDNGEEIMKLKNQSKEELQKAMERQISVEK